MEFKQSGFHEETDWDRTLLGDGEDSSEADSDQEEVQAAHGMWDDDGEVAAEHDPLSTIPGATSSTTLRATAQACARGLVAKKIDSSNNFEIFFDLRLHNRQKDRRGIAHFSVGGVVGSQLPRICVAPNSTHLWIFIRHGHFRAKLATRAIPLNKTVKVRFRLLQNKITVDIDNRIEGILEAEGLHIPVPAKIFSYFNGPGDKAADATVSGAVYRWRHFALRPRVQATGGPQFVNGLRGRDQFQSLSTSNTIYLLSSSPKMLWRYFGAAPEHPFSVTRLARGDHDL